MANLSLIRWAGGKGRQLNDLLPFIPDGRIYVEPFGGGASVLLNRPRSEVEVYNDLDRSLVNLFMVVRDDVLFERFAEKLRWTPYAKEIFVDALEDVEFRPLDGITEDNTMVMRAVKFFTILNQSISGKRLAQAGDWATGRGDNLADRWTLRQEKLGLIRDRLRYVQIECRDALEILEKWDSPDTVFYCDPPYVLETRGKNKYYAIEPGDDWHDQLVVTLAGLQGAVVLSGYLHARYDILSRQGWVADSYKQGAMMTVHEEGKERDERREVVWRNPKALERGIKVPLALEFARRDQVYGPDGEVVTPRKGGENAS